MDLASMPIAIIVLGLILALLVLLVDQVPALAPFKVAARAFLALTAIFIVFGMVFGGVVVPGFYIR
jgi:hypothetical protein